VGGKQGGSGEISIHVKPVDYVAAFSLPPTLAHLHPAIGGAPGPRASSGRMSYALH
jgi:hypothetical protein